MIKVTDLKALKAYFPYVPDEAIDFMASLTVDTENGKYPFGEKVFVNVMNVQTTRDEASPMEAHEKYVDFQYMVCGEEKIIVADKTGLKVVDEYNEAKDRAFYAWENGESVVYATGEGVVLYPNEGHLPGLAVNEEKTVKKAVMKIRI